MTVTLNLAEQRLATFLGTMRHRVNRQAQVVDQQHNPTLTGLDVDIDGVEAEMNPQDVEAVFEREYQDRLQIKGL